MDTIRLQAYLSKCGVCSRRKAEELIRGGKVKVNGKIEVEPYCRVSPDKDKVEVDGESVSVKDKVYLVFHKPAGVTTTKKDKFADKTIFDFLPRRLKHLHPVGRLDKDTSGLLILTNDGEVTYRLTHPKFRVGKTYNVFLDKAVKKSDVSVLSRGIVLDGKKTSPCKIKIASSRKVNVVIYEGRKRQVRRMFFSLGYRVTRLFRTGEGFLKLSDLQEGRFRFLSKYEIARLYKELKIS